MGPNHGEDYSIPDISIGMVWKLWVEHWTY